MNKKLLVLLTAFSLVLGAFGNTAFATTLQDSVGSDASDITIGEDITQGAVTEYDSVDTNDTSFEQTNSVDVFATKCSKVTFFIPDTLIGSGNNDQISYKVGVKGDIASNQKINITPDATFQLTDGERDITATITQTKTEWLYNEVNDADFNYTIGYIDFEIPAGVFHGTFNFNIKITQE